MKTKALSLSRGCRLHQVNTRNYFHHQAVTVSHLMLQHQVVVVTLTKMSHIKSIWAEAYPTTVVAVVVAVVVTRFELEEEVEVVAIATVVEVVDEAVVEVVETLADTAQVIITTHPALTIMLFPLTPPMVEHHHNQQHHHITDQMITAVLQMVVATLINNLHLQQIDLPVGINLHIHQPVINTAIRTLMITKTSIMQQTETLSGSMMTTAQPVQTTRSVPSSTIDPAGGIKHQLPVEVPVDGIVLHLLHHQLAVAGTGTSLQALVPRLRLVGIGVNKCAVVVS